VTLPWRFLGIFISFTISIAPLQLIHSAVAKETAQTTPLRFSVNDNLLAELQSISLLEKTLKLPSATDAEILAAAKADYQRIVLTLYENGYFSASIQIQVNGREAADYSLFDKVGAVKSASITVNEGSIFQFGTAQITPITESTELPSEFAPGHTAKPSVIENAADIAIEDWRENSHPKAQLSGQQLIADHRAKTLDARLQIDPGPKAKFGKLTVTGNQRMRTNRILKIAGLPEGADYTTTQLKKSANRLRATGIFSSAVLTEADTITPDGFLDITANVTEAKLRQIGIDASLSTNDGAALKTFWLHRNLFGGGEQLRFDADISGIGGNISGVGSETGGTSYEVGASLIRPATITPDTNAILNVNYGREDEPNYTLDKFTTGLTFDHRFSETLTGSIGIRYSNIDTNDAFGQRQFNVLGFPLGVQHDTRANKLSSDDGIFLSLEAAPFVEMKQSNTGVHATFDGRTYKGLGAEKNVVFATRLLLGSVIGPDLQDLPSNFLFYSGGSGSVRGHDFQSLGIILPSGGKVGGKSFVGLSAELRSMITAKIGGVIFADYGYVGPKSTFGVDGDSQSGVGFGLWYATPIGPIRADIAFPADSVDKFKKVNIYIGIGQAF
jgi:translocation and assembly module TamA